MKKAFLIWQGKFYAKQYLTQREICCIIKMKHERPVLNSRGEMLTTDDIDFEGEE
jgi:hypothetical protein